MNGYIKVCSIVTLIGAALAAHAATYADLALLHGRVITVDTRDQVAEALAIGGGRDIVAHQPLPVAHAREGYGPFGHRQQRVIRQGAAATVGRQRSGSGAADRTCHACH